MDGQDANGENICERCIEGMKARGCDFSLLFWLRNPEILGDSGIGKDLQAFLEETGISWDLFGSSKFRDAFFGKLRAEFNRTGIKKISPENYVVDCGTGGKERAIQKSREAKWPRPHQTFCFQTRGNCNSAFFVYQTWQDGLRKILELLESQVEREFRVLQNIFCKIFLMRLEQVYAPPTGKDIHVQQIYEHCWGDNRLNRLLIDWEVESPWMAGRRTAAEIKLAAEAFPAWFVRRLEQTGCLDPDATVWCTVKDKSRSIEGGKKVSYHFIFNLVGNPRGSHRVACGRVLEPFLTKLKTIAKEKSFATLPDKEIDQPWIGIDWRTVAGSHGFSTPFSKKKDTDPYPSVPYYLLLSKQRGEGWTGARHDFSWAREEHSMASLGVDKCLRILYHASYTPAAGDCVSYLNLRAVPVQAGSYLHTSLHDYIQATSEDTQKQDGKAKQAKKTLPMARIGNFPCPAHLDRKPPVIHTHPSNGVFIAVDSEKETVYCSCSECEYESDRVRKGGNLELVKGTENQRYAWAILTKEAYNTLVGTPPVTGKRGPDTASASESPGKASRHADA